MGLWVVFSGLGLGYQLPGQGPKGPAPQGPKGPGADVSVICQDGGCGLVFGGRSAG